MHRDTASDLSATGVSVDLNVPTPSGVSQDDVIDVVVLEIPDDIRAEESGDSISQVTVVELYDNNRTR